MESKIAQWRECLETICVFRLVHSDFSTIPELDQWFHQTEQVQIVYPEKRSEMSPEEIQDQLQLLDHMIEAYNQVLVKCIQTVQKLQ